MEINFDSNQNILWRFFQVESSARNFMGEIFSTDGIVRRDFWGGGVFLRGINFP